MQEKRGQQMGAVHRIRSWADAEERRRRTRHLENLAGSAISLVGTSSGNEQSLIFQIATESFTKVGSRHDFKIVGELHELLQFRWNLWRAISH
jgi:hypothetical protein